MFVGRRAQRRGSRGARHRLRRVFRPALTAPACVSAYRQAIEAARPLACPARALDLARRRRPRRARVDGFGGGLHWRRARVASLERPCRRVQRPLRAASTGAVTRLLLASSTGDPRLGARHRATALCDAAPTCSRCARERALHAGSRCGDRADALTRGPPGIVRCGAGVLRRGDVDVGRRSAATAGDGRSRTGHDGPAQRRAARASSTCRAERRRERSTGRPVMRSSAWAWARALVAPIPRGCARRPIARPRGRSRPGRPRRGRRACA